jgi:hypothetical protein
MRGIREALAAIAIAGQLACCSTQVWSAGYQRQCVPLFGWHRDRQGPPQAPAPASPPVLPGHEVQWDDELSIYTVAGQPCLFLRLGTLYLTDAGRWRASTSIDGPWRKIATSELPGELRWRLAEARCQAPPHSSGSPKFRTMYSW